MLNVDGKSQILTFQDDSLLLLSYLAEIEDAENKCLNMAELLFNCGQPVPSLLTVSGNNYQEKNDNNNNYNYFTNQQSQFCFKDLPCISNEPQFADINSDLRLWPIFSSLDGARESNRQTDTDRKIRIRSLSSELTENNFTKQIRQDELLCLNICASCNETATKALIPCCHISFCDMCVKNKTRCGVCHVLFRDIKTVSIIS